MCSITSINTDTYFEKSKPGFSTNITGRYLKKMYRCFQRFYKMTFFTLVIFDILIELKIKNIRNTINKNRILKLVFDSDNTYLST